MLFPIGQKDTIGSASFHSSIGWDGTNTENSKKQDKVG